MVTDEQLIQSLRAALERESAGIVPPSDLLASIHEELRSAPATRDRKRLPSRGPRLRLARLAPVAALLVVVAVIAAFLGVQSRKPAGPAATRGGFTIVYRAEPTAQVPDVNRAAVARAVSLMRRRIAAVAPGAAASITVTSAGTKIFVHAASGTPSSREQLLSLVGTTARLEVYDWEANALTPSGKPVASLLASQDPSAIEISQGGSAAAPGSPGAGSLPLYQAVLLASKQPSQQSKDNSRFGPEGFAFGAPGSAACAAAAAHYRVFLLDPHAHCYLAGPQNTRSDLNSSLPPGVRPSEAQELTVQPGTVVLQAVPASYGNAPPWYSPAAQFYVLRDHVSLWGNEITDPHQSTDESGSPDVTFRFTSPGASVFRHVTAEIAQRGSLVSHFGQQFSQHFAVAIDTQLITVPSIDYRTYPDGITGSTADITGPFTIRSARTLATQLRLGSLPVNLKLLVVTSQR